jgi:hypothetical protein
MKTTLATTTSSPSSGLSTTTKAVIGAVVGGVVLLALGIFIGWLCCRPKRRAAYGGVVPYDTGNTGNTGNVPPPPPQPYPYQAVPTGYEFPAQQAPNVGRGINSEMGEETTYGGRLQSRFEDMK